MKKLLIDAEPRDSIAMAFPAVALSVVSASTSINCGFSRPLGSVDTPLNGRRWTLMAG